MKIVQFFGIVLMCFFLNGTVDGNFPPPADPQLTLSPRLLYKKKSGGPMEFKNPVDYARTLLYRMNLQHLHLELMQASSTLEGLLFEMKTYDQVAEIMERWNSLDLLTAGKFYKNFELKPTYNRFTE